MTAAPLVCSSCGIEPSRAGARYCDACGKPLGGPAGHAEFKQVTVLFADVVRSMDIAAAVGPERLREVMAELVGRSAAVVRRYGGTMDKFTGDGLMAVFGAPIALEDHGVRACLAALAIQTEADRLAVEVQRADGITLELRVGLNSGQVVAGEIGSGITGYTAIGQQVGLAQRMESVAPPGGVMLSESTCHLVEHAATLAERELVRIKGFNEPIGARRLLAIEPRHVLVGGPESTLVGRSREMAAIGAILDRTVHGRGVVVGVAGPPGIGKSRLARETAALAAGRGFEVFWSFCESHASDIPFHAVTRLLRARTGIAEMDRRDARAHVRAQMPDAAEEDLVLLDDLLGIAEPDIPSSYIAPDARRRRLTALINAASLVRTQPALYIIEDAHWIDAVSESMLVDFLSVVPQTPAMVLITYRPEYRGGLIGLPSAQTIALAPLDDSDTSDLLDELLGSDRSVGELGTAIVSRVGGNPFFAEEIVRDLVERGVLRGQRGAHVCQSGITEVSVPPNLQATIGARIDRLGREAKLTLNAAAVIGTRFGTELLTSLGVEPVLDELIRAELIDHVTFTPRADYAFRHPLIRAVAYESQLKSDRAEWHRRLAAAIPEREPGTVDENAALIAQHLEAAGDLRAAYGWLMRAGGWSTNRDIAAARISWERARQIADALPADDADRTAMRITPRTMLCVSAWRAAGRDSSVHFEQLRELCAIAGDKASLAIAMTGLTTELLWHGRAREASRLATEQMTLLESIGDAALTIGAYVAITVKIQTGEFADVLRWSQTVIELAQGDAAKGANLAMGSPLAAALLFRGLARYCLGLVGWRQDLDDALATAQRSDPVTRALIVAVTYGSAITSGVLRADDRAVREIEVALQTAEKSSDDTALGSAQYFLGVVLMSQDAAADRQRGLELVTQVRDTWVRERTRLYLVPSAEVVVAREMVMVGDRDGAIPVMRKAVDDLFHQGQWGTCGLAIAVLIETLLDGGTDAEVSEAEATIDRLAKLPPDGWAVRDIWLMRLRALLSRARGDETGYRHLVSRYRAMAESLGFEGHVDLAHMMQGGTASSR
jgi:class 3 adenylate cyclase